MKKKCTVCERRRLSMRMAVQRRINRGLVYGYVPLGYRNDEGRLVLDQAEMDTVALILSLRGAGLSLRAVARELTVAGRSTKRGGNWGPQNIANIERRFRGVR